MTGKVFEIGSEYDWNSTKPYLERKKNEHFHVDDIHTFKFLRSGRDALRYIAKAYRHEKKVVLMPALCCSCMPDPFEDEGYEVIYYKLKDNFEVCVEDVLSKIKSDSIFLFMNYFAIPSLSKPDREAIIKSHRGIVTIEDITHDFLKRKMENCEADITICSIRKWLAVPDGGLLFSRSQLSQIGMKRDSYFADKRVSAMKKKNIYLESGLSKEKNIFRMELSESNNYIDAVKNIAKISDASIEILEHVNFTYMYKDRLKNSRLLFEKICNVKKIEVLESQAVDSTLYFPILVDNQKKVQEKLAQKGVYAPVIWPLPKQAEGICKIADKVSAHMLGIPCDHRYSKEEMLKVAEIICEVVE